ncbi:MAG: hypothetical protein ACOYNF_17520, partial [Rhodoferax sp.]
AKKPYVQCFYPDARPFPDTRPFVVSLACPELAEGSNHLPFDCAQGERVHQRVHHLGWAWADDS